MPRDPTRTPWGHKFLKGAMINAGNSTIGDAATEHIGLGDTGAVALGKNVI